MVFIERNLLLKFLYFRTSTGGAILFSLENSTHVIQFYYERSGVRTHQKTAARQRAAGDNKILHKTILQRFFQNHKLEGQTWINGPI